MVYQLNHDEVEMNNIPLITVEPVAELLRSNGKNSRWWMDVITIIKELLSKPKCYEKESSLIEIH